MRMAGEIRGLFRIIKNASFLPPNHLSFSPSTLRVSKMRLCDVKAHGGLPLAGEVTDIIIIRVWFPMYRHAQWLWSRPLGVFKMNKVAWVALPCATHHGL